MGKIDRIDASGDDRDTSLEFEVVRRGGVRQQFECLTTVERLLVSGGERADAMLLPHRAERAVEVVDAALVTL
jgi:hypothetical protein